jgi:hypothetical protein
MDVVASYILRDTMIASITTFSKYIADPECSIVSKDFEDRANFLRVLDRLDKRANQSAGRAKMCIGNIKLTVGEVDSINYAITELLKVDDVALKKLHAFSDYNIKPAIRRHHLERIAFMISEESDVKNDKVSNNTKPAALAQQ